jgi:glycosyltransferase involved in cell wall biosynthesis
MGLFPSICCLYRSGAWASRLRSEVQVFELRKKRGLDLSVVKPLRDYLVRHKIDILHTHNPGTLLYGVLAAKWAGTPAIINTEHGFAYDLSLKARVKEKLLYYYVDRITAVSDKLKNDLISIYALKDKKIQTIRNGVLSAKIEEHPSISRKKVGMSRNCFNIGIVGRLVPVKNHGMLLDAFSMVRTKNRMVRLWIVGSGELETRLKRQAQRLKIQDDVVFMGSRVDIPVILNALDLFVLCSSSEGLSITLLEAMSAGLPIVATDVGGNSEVIENERSGLLVETNQPEDLARSISRLIDNKDEAAKMGLMARQRYLDSFSVDLMAQRMVNLYESVWLEKAS